MTKPKRPAACRVMIVEQGEGLWGAQRYLLRLAPLLADRGIEQVLAAPAASATAAAWRAAGYQQVVLPVPENRSARRPDGRVSPIRTAREATRMGHLAWLTARLARRLDADVIHANSHWSHLEVTLAARIARRPALLLLHEENEPDLLGRIRGLAVLGAAATVAVSGAVAASLPERAARRVTVIRNGVDAGLLTPRAGDPDVRSQLTGDPSAPLLLAMSRLDPRKGIDKVIRAIAELPPDLASTRLAVAGAPSLDPAHGDRLRRLGAELLGERVRFLGARDDVADLLRASDALVLASSLEGLPLSVLEAQACGRPVVAFPTAGVPEVVTDGRTGLLARQDDVVDLAAVLTRLLRDPALARRLGAEARRAVVARHTVAGQADALAAAYLRLAARRGGPAGHTAQADHRPS